MLCGGNSAKGGPDWHPRAPRCWHHQLHCPAIHPPIGRQGGCTGGWINGWQLVVGDSPCQRKCLAKWWRFNHEKSGCQDVNGGGNYECKHQHREKLTNISWIVCLKKGCPQDLGPAVRKSQWSTREDVGGLGIFQSQYTLWSFQTSLLKMARFRNSWFTRLRCWFSIAMSVYQRLHILFSCSYGESKSVLKWFIFRWIVFSSIFHSHIILW